LTTKEIYSLLVLEGGLSPEYVLDKMQMYELEALISSLYQKNRESWEQTRLLAYILA
jgi:predicted transcriptional regulator